MSGRRLTEAFAQTAALRIDREAGVIHGVRILGPVSKNTYGISGVDSTEYAASAHDDARRMYEGMSVRLNHVRGNDKERQVQDKFGKLRNVRTVIESDGPATYGDLHYLKADPMAGKVCEDVERQLGMYGLSHDAYAGKERVDKSRKRLVIESITKVNSVDLVDSAATNRNLWESANDRPKTSLRAVLETLKDLPPGKSAWLRRLSEDTDMSAPLSAECDSDPVAALDAGFRAAILAVLDDEGLDLAAKKTRIGMLLTVQDKLKSGADPEAPTEKDMPTEPNPKVESIDPAEHAALKAKVAAMEADQAATAAVRKLCESVKFTPSDVQMTALKAMSDDATRKALIESFRPAAEPRSGYTGRPVAESQGEYKHAEDTKTFVQRIRR